ncbi:MAG: (2Fe-2S)-binding protein [Saprospirales bacterium]|nr:(2Fe-2S)-binding protein [Saprospirales bacterium]
MKNIKPVDMPEMVTITIDGREIQAAAGRNLVEIARENGIFIPSLCYYPHLEQPLGTCRVCTCQINGKTGVACTEKIREGLAVEVNTPALNDLRKAVLEMMFAEGNHFCPACEKSGNCDLQHMGYELGLAVTRFPHLFEDRIIDFTPSRMVLEHNRCIKCRRCVEEILTDEGKRVFYYVNRGNETLVGIDNEQEARLSEQQALNAMHICPTGAILVRGKNLSKPFGDRTFDMKSVQTPKLEPEQPFTAKAQREKKVIATVSLAGCFGCHMSMLDVDTGLLDLVEFVEIHRSPLTDFKSFGKRCHLGLIEGGCCNSENVETLRAFREHCDILVAIGECAIWGGLPAMRNTIPLGECLEEAYLSAPAQTGVVPYHEDLPKILDKVYGCHEVVQIDYYIPGCPPSSSHIWKVVENLLWGAKHSVLYSEFKYD